MKWGNSLGLRIPKNFAEEVRVTEGTFVDLTMKDGNLLIRVVKQPEISLDALLAAITDANLHSEVDTGDAVGVEVW